MTTVVSAEDGAAKDAPAPLPPAQLPRALGERIAGGLPPMGRQVLLLTAGGLVADLALHGLQGSGSWLGLGVFAGGWVWLARIHGSRQGLPAPKTAESWKERCNSLLNQFVQLEADQGAQAKRAAALEELLALQGRKDLRLAMVSSGPPSDGELPAFQNALRGARSLQLLVSDPLPTKSSHWRWGDAFSGCDALIFRLKPPLMAAELRWLEALPEQLPLWVLMETGHLPSPETALADLLSQWPAANPGRLLLWDGRSEELTSCLSPLHLWLAKEGGQLPQTTLCRCLEQLHGGWQTDLERLRRVQWRQLQQRTQWLVAAGVVVSPAMGLDLVVLSVTNGLMLREMARLWDSPWTLEQMKAAAMHVGKAALALGVVEWSSQAFAAAFQLHGSTWLVGSTLQALSAAYLTRVIGHAMADLMARSVGVSEPDLEAIKAEAPLLVAKAAEAERLDWGTFLQEAKSWLLQQDQNRLMQAGGA